MALNPSIQLAQQYLYQIGGPILLVLGNISCMINLIIFTRKNFRKNPCSIYFLAFNMANFILINLPFLSAVLFIGYNINNHIYNLIICRFNYYVAFSLGILSPCYLILASIDRIFITSRNVQTRRRSTNRLAWISIITVTVFWMLFHIHALISTNILQIGPTQYTCYFSLGTYLIFVSYYLLIIKGICVPLLLITFGLWTLKNIRTTMHNRRVAPIIVIGVRRSIPVILQLARSKDRQLSLMLLIETTIYVIFTLVLSCFLMYEQITQYKTKSFEEIQIYSLLFIIANFSNYIPYCVGGYINIFVSKTFRKEVIDTLRCQCIMN